MLYPWSHLECLIGEVRVILVYHSATLSFQLSFPGSFCLVAFPLEENSLKTWQLKPQRKLTSIKKDMKSLKSCHVSTNLELSNRLTEDYFHTAHTDVLISLQVH